MSGLYTPKITEKLCQIQRGFDKFREAGNFKQSNFQTLRSARDSLFKAGNKNSFDMSSGGPKDHFPRFFWELEVFFKEGPFFATPSVEHKNSTKF